MLMFFFTKPKLIIWWLLLKISLKKDGAMLRATVMDDITTYHTTLIEAAEIANKANVKKLVFYHLTPAPRNYIH